jgi:hypothetical protein
MRQRLIIVALALLVSGCASALGPAATPDEFGALTSAKELVAKRAPETLIARDGSICRVSPDRFEDADVGQTLRCRWRHD